MDRLFVYGSLRRGHRGATHSLLSDFTFESRASFQGKMYDLGPYPAVVESADPEHVVHGELYRTDHENIFGPLDRYEGSQYRRQRVQVTTEGGVAVDSWIYLYTGPTKQAAIIESGDYADRRR